MKKLTILLVSIFLLNVNYSLHAQTYYKVHEKTAAINPHAKAAFPNVSVTFQPITYSQINFQTSFLEVGYKDSKFNVSASTFSFTPSYVWGSANAKITITSDKDTLYELSSNLYYGGGLKISENVVTGKAGLAPCITGGVDKFAALVGYDFVNNLIVAGISTTINDIPFINKHTNLKLK